MGNASKVTVPMEGVSNFCGGWLSGALESEKEMISWKNWHSGQGLEDEREFGR